MNKLVLLLLMLFLGLGSILAQTELILGDINTGKYVNLEILADTLADGSQAHDIYKVEANKFYAFDGTLITNFELVIEGPDNGWIGDDATPPVFFQTPTSGGDPRDMFQLTAGGSITLKNILLSGLHGNGENISSFVLSTAGDKIIIDNCVFSDHKDHAFKIGGTTEQVSVTNCIFLNGVRKSSSPWGGMNIRIDANLGDLLLENNTSVNSSRLLGNGGNFFYTNMKEIHCTYLNIQVSAHELHYYETLQANNIFYNWGWRGRDAQTIVYEAYFTPWDYFADVENKLDSISLYHGRNLLYLDPAFIDYYANNMADAGIMPCLLWNVDVDSTIEADDNFTIGKNYWQFDPELTKAPNNLDSMLAWVAYYWNGTGNWPDWRVPLPVTYDVGTGMPLLSNWPPDFDLSYSRPYLQTAGTDGLPLGDLNWFPDAKATYMANRDTYIAALQDSITNATDVHVPYDSASAIITPDMVSVEDFISGPSEFSLYQNYPNPFNPSTSIAFKMAKADKISMKIYDITGQLVKTVIDNKNYTAGTHIVTIDMAHNSSGVYFTVLKSGSKKLVRKMMLIK